MINRILFPKDDKLDEQLDEIDDIISNISKNHDVSQKNLDEIKEFEQWDKYMPGPSKSSTPFRKHSGVISPRSMKSFIEKMDDSSLETSLETPTLKKFISKNTSPDTKDMPDLLDIRHDDILIDKAVTESLEGPSKLHRKSEVVPKVRAYGDQIRDEYWNILNIPLADQPEERGKFFDKWKKKFTMEEINSELFK